MRKTLQQKSVPQDSVNNSQLATHASQLATRNPLFDNFEQILLSSLLGIPPSSQFTTNNKQLTTLEPLNSPTLKLLNSKLPNSKMLNSKLSAIQKTLNKTGVKVDKIDIVMRSEKQESPKNLAQSLRPVDLKINPDLSGQKSSKNPVEKSPASFPQDSSNTNQTKHKPKPTIFSKGFSEQSIPQNGKNSQNSMKIEQVLNRSKNPIHSSEKGVHNSKNPPPKTINPKLSTLKLLNSQLSNSQTLKLPTFQLSNSPTFNSQLPTLNGLVVKKVSSNYAIVQLSNDVSKQLSSSALGQLQATPLRRILQTQNSATCGQNSEIRVNFSNENNKMVGKITVNNAKMKQLLNSKLSAIQETLNKAGVKVDKIDIIMRSEKQESPKNLVQSLRPVDLKINPDLSGQKSSKNPVEKSPAPFPKDSPNTNQTKHKPKSTIFSKGFSEHKISQNGKNSQSSIKIEQVLNRSKNPVHFSPQDSSNKEFSEKGVHDSKNPFTKTPNSKLTTHDSIGSEVRAGENQGQKIMQQHSSVRLNSSPQDSSNKGVCDNAGAETKVGSQNSMNRANPQILSTPKESATGFSERNSGHKIDKGLNLPPPPKDSAKKESVTEVRGGINKGLSVLDLGNELKFKGLPKGMPPDNFEKLANQLKLNFRGGHSEAKIELNPDWLGKLSIKLVIEDTKLAGKIVVDTLVAKHLLEHSLSELKSALRSTGLEVEDFNITLSQDSEQGKDSYGRAVPWSRYPGKSGLFHPDSKNPAHWDRFFFPAGGGEGTNYASETGRIDYFA
ncbi:flagellar hook-length control protein FliK [candidate division WOR-3 bacterium]|nr:flagellar hook-length control protein FliK [candidate division WOR-3 bacterium]